MELRREHPRLALLKFIQSLLRGHPSHADRLCSVRRGGARVRAADGVREEGEEELGAEAFVFDRWGVPAKRAGGASGASHCEGVE